jgi:lipid A 4'-phosphatase
MKLLYRHFWMLLFVFCAALFILVPAIDIRFSSLFFRAGEGFYLKQSPMPLLSYNFINWTEKPLILGLLLAWLASTTVLRQSLAKHRAPLAFLLVTLLLGPGLAVNTILKNHIGRARPERIIEFGGDQKFTPAFFPANACEHNCSFVSGHAGQGFFPIALAWAYPRRRRFWLGFGIATGSFAGMMRVVQGKHFLSDVVFAFFVVYAVAAITYHAFRHFGWLPVDKRSGAGSVNTDAVLRIINNCAM